MSRWKLISKGILLLTSIVMRICFIVAYWLAVDSHSLWFLGLGNSFVCLAILFHLDDRAMGA